jgi:hypothetical protein
VPSIRAVRLRPLRSRRGLPGWLSGMLICPEFQPAPPNGPVFTGLPLEQLAAVAVSVIAAAARAIHRAGPGMAPADPGAWARP